MFFSSQMTTSDRIEVQTADTEPLKLGALAPAGPTKM